MPGSDATNSEDQVISAEELKRYKDEYGLAGQLDLLLGIHRDTSLTGKVVLEIGGSNIPRSFIFDVLKARRWVSVDRVYVQNRNLWPRQYGEVQVIPIAAGLELDALAGYVVLDGSVEFLPHSFAGRFDAIVSIDAFEHILKFATMLERAFTALKPGGKLVATYSPIWPSHFGHHVWGITDNSGRTFYPDSSPIPAWGHLLMRPNEMYEYLLDHTDAETADEIVNQVYHSENLNRLFVEDYEAYFRSSRFASHDIRSFVSDVTPTPEIQSELERLHPGRKQFSRIGNFVCCEKAVNGGAAGGTVRLCSTARSDKFAKASGSEAHSSTFKLKDTILFAGSQQPWESLASGFAPEPPIPSMMCLHELRFLHYIAKHHYTGSGAIVDFGPLVGSSTYAFASGMSRGKIFSYDLWRAWHGLDASYSDGKQLAFGDDLLPLFLRNTAPFSAMITPRKGSIMNSQWSDGPIEFMLIDAAKKPEIMAHIANEFFPHLMPGAIVIQQDYVAAECPWLHICMVQMKEYFELIDSPEGGSVCFRVVKPIPQLVLPETYWMAPDARDCMAAARSVLTEWRALCMWLAEARYEVICGHTDRAAEILRLVLAHPDFNPHLDYDIKFIQYFIDHNERGIPGFEFE